MKFDHVVNHNGIYYAAGDEVPIKEESKAVEEAAALPKEDGEPVTTEFEPQRRGRGRRKD